MAEEDLIREEDMLEEEDLDALDRRVRREIEEGWDEEEEPEVVELPQNVQRMQGKIESLRQEIGNLEAQFAQVQDALDTRVAALSWYSEQVMKHFEVAASENG